MRHILPALFALLAVACGPARDPGPVITGDPANAFDVDAGTLDPDAADSPDAGGDDVDAGSSGNNGGIPTGQTCNYEDSGTFQGGCDVVRQIESECPNPDQACRIGVMLLGTDTVLSAFCQDISDTLIADGEPCLDAEGSCMPGSFCVPAIDECRTMCYPASGFGCEPDQHCRHPSASWLGLGYCNAGCEL